MVIQNYIYVIVIIVMVLVILFKKRKTKKKHAAHYKSEEIIEKLSIEINLNPKDETAYYRRGKERLKLKDREGAYKDFCKSRDLGYQKAEEIIENELFDLEHNNKSEGFQGYLDSIPNIDRQKALKYKNEFEDFTKIIERNPKNYSAYLMRASIKEILKDYSGAIEDINKAILIKHNFADAFSQRGVVRYKMNDRNEALHDFKIAEKLGSKKAVHLIKKYFGEK